MKLDRDGTFRARPIEWSVEAYESGSACIVYSFEVIQQWDEATSQWSEPWPTGWTIYGRVWIQKKDGSMNEGAVKSAIEAGILDRDPGDITGEESPPSVSVHIDVVYEEYDGKKNLKVAWINPDAEVPRRGGMKRSDPAALKAIKSNLGSQVKALLATKKKSVPSSDPLDGEEPPF